MEDNERPIDMTYAQSFSRTVSSFVDNFAPWGIFATLVIASITGRIVDSLWPDLSFGTSLLVSIVVAVVIYCPCFFALAAIVAFFRRDEHDGSKTKQTEE